jgi:nitronate monooxygenase
VKAFTFYRGMKALKQAAEGATYKTLWVAGPSIEHVTEIKSIEKIIEQLMKEYETA